MPWKKSLRVSAWTLLFAALAAIVFAPVGSEEVPKPYEYFSNPWMAVGLKDYRDGTRIAPDGTLFLGEGAKCGFLVGESYSPLPESIVRTLERDSLRLTAPLQPGANDAEYEVALPIVHLLRTEKEGLSYEFTVFASPLNPADESSYDSPTKTENYLNQVCIRIRSNASEPIKAPVAISLSRAVSIVKSVPAGGESDRYVCQEKGRLAALLGLPPGTSIKKVKDSLRLRVPVIEDDTAELYLVIPHVPVAEETLPQVPVPPQQRDLADRTTFPGTAAYFNEVHRRTKQYWRRLLRKGAVIGIPEQKPSLTYYASIIGNFIARDGIVIKPGEGFYDNFYLRDGAFQTHALDLAGFTSEAGESLAHFLRFQKPDGQFISQGGELDGNGQALWGLYAHYALTGDRQWLREIYPAAAKAVSWLEKGLQKEAGAAAPYPGVLFASIADGENLMRTPKHIVGYDFWNLRGVDCVAGMAEALGKKEDVENYRRLFETYKASIENALKKAGVDWFPPTYEGVGTSWGNLTMLHPTPLFDAQDSRVTATLDRVRAGFVEGTIRWAPETLKVIHPYMSSYVTNSEIIRGEREKAIDHFYHFLAHTTSTHDFPEGVYYETRTAWNNTLPHQWASAQYMIVLRNMLLRTEGDVLRLLPAAPVSWLRPGKRIIVLGAPTVFGKVSLVVSGVEKGCEATFSWPDRATPKQVILHAPLGAVVKRVWRDDVEMLLVQKGEVVLPEGCQRVRIEWSLPPAETDRTFEDYAREYEANSP